MVWVTLALPLRGWAENNTTNIITVATNAGDLYFVGSLGTNNYLEIRTSGGLTNAVGVIGAADSASNNYALVTGSSARWVNTNSVNTNILDLGELYVGSNSPGNRLTITNGARVSTDVAYIGYTTNSVNNRVLITSTNSRLDFISMLAVGYSGAGNQLIVTNGAKVNSQNDGIIGGGFEVGFEYLASNNMAIVTGNGSTWTNDGNMYVGYQSSGNLFTITNGGKVTNSYAFIGFLGSSNNIALVTGPNSVWSSLGESVVLGGAESVNNSLVVTNGALLTALGSRIGDNNASISNQALVIGSNSRCLLSADLSVGEYSPFNWLTVQGGGQFASSNAYVGHHYTALSNTVLVTGSGARWSNQWNLYVGSEGSGNGLIVSNAGQVSSFNGYIGGDTNGHDNLVLVTGSGSQFTNTGALVVGFYTGGNSLTVSNGGKVICDTAQVGVIGSNNVAFVTGTNSQWLISNELYVGQVGASNQLQIGAGGLVTNYSGYVGSSGTNSFALVSGPGAQWRNAELYLGYDGLGTNLLDGSVTVPGWCQLTVESNAVLQSPNLYVGYGAANNQVLVTSGALVQATNVIIGFTDEATNNLLSVVGASLIVTNTALNAQVDVRHGTLSLSNATVRTANLSIATNGALTGVGTVTATTVTNSGLLAPGFAGGRLILSGTLTEQTSSTSSFELGGYTPGVTYDSLIVSNAARLGGTLAVRIVSGFESALTNNASFTLMTAGSFSGAFNNVASGSQMMTADGVAEFLVTYSGNTLVLSQAKYDSDNDGIPNWWEVAKGFNPNDPSDATKDADGDRATNLQEYQGGTNPTNALSFFHLTSVTREGRDARVAWTTVAGKMYVLQGNIGPANGSLTNGYYDISPVLVATGDGESTTNFVDQGAFGTRSARYYRVRLATNTVSLDSDSDGMPDWWEWAHGFNPNDFSDAALDADGDGISNLQEFLAGTDPRLGLVAAAPRITAVARQANDLKVTWTTFGGLKYVLQGTAGGISGGVTNGFTDLSPVFVVGGVGESTTNFVDVGVVTNRVARYYRVKVVP